MCATGRCAGRWLAQHHQPSATLFGSEPPTAEQRGTQVLPHRLHREAAERHSEEGHSAQGVTAIVDPLQLPIGQTQHGQCRAPAVGISGSWAGCGGWGWAAKKIFVKKKKTEAQGTHSKHCTTGACWVFPIPLSWVAEPRVVTCGLAYFTLCGWCVCPLWKRAVVRCGSGLV